MSDKAKIIISGIAMTTPLGNSLPEVSAHLMNQQSGIRTFSDAAYHSLGVYHAGIVDDGYHAQTHRKDARTLTLLQVIKQQLDTLFSPALQKIPEHRRALILGVEPASLNFFDNYKALLAASDSDAELKIDYATLLQRETDERGLVYSGAFPEYLLADLAASYGFKGPALLNMGTCAASAQAIGQAKQLLEQNQVDVVIAGGISSKLDVLSISRLRRIGALALTDADNYQATSRPFDKHRQGFTIAEGAICFVLQREGELLTRETAPLAIVQGYGTCLDGYSITDPDPEYQGMQTSMRDALNNADLVPQDIDYINAHGTSTQKNDEIESQAIESIFGHNKSNADYALSSTKSSHGHLISASGAMEAAVCVSALQHQFVPPTLNYQTYDEKCSLDYTPNHMRTKPINYALSNSFGLGGMNATLILARYEND